MKNYSIINKTRRDTFIFLLTTLSFISFSSCNDGLENTIYQTSNVQMIDEYMESSENNLTDFLAIIDKADYRGMLHAYGTYTCFVPTNEAIQTYLSETGMSLSTLTKEQAEEIIGFHTVNDTIRTGEFVDGRLASTNIKKQYLTTRTQVDEQGQVYLEVNRQARIIVKDVLLGNGYIHVINKALKPANGTVAETIDALPDAQFSFIKSLIKETKFDKELSIEQDSVYFTFFLQSNEVFKELNIDTKEDLLERLRQNTPGINDNELIRNYVMYHCVPERKYMTDLMIASALQTYGSKQVLSFSMSKESLLINEFKVGLLNEEGVLVDRTGELSDLTCSNGVIHLVLGQLEIRNRKAYRVNWDIADQPEIKALKTYRKNGANTVFQPGDLSEMSWGGKNSPTATYQCATSYSSSNQYIYGDYLTFRICTNVMQWVEFTTPLLVEGTYKIWFCWRRAQPFKFRTTFKQDGEEDQILSTIIEQVKNEYLPIKYVGDTKVVDHDKMEQEGWKQYNAKVVNNVFCSRLAGAIKVTSTGRHILRLDALGGSGGSGISWDMIQFIPIDEDQVWPMLDMNGDSVEKGTPAEEIYPQ